MTNKQLVVSVYGSSQPQPGDSIYEDGVRLGKSLAEADYTVMTGGYGGMMEAVSRGADSAGGHVIGVTVNLFESSGRRKGPNQFVSEVIQYPTLSERLLHLVKKPDCAVAMAGGIGTLSEVTLLWSLIQTGEVAPMPLVLVGDHWTTLLEQYYGKGTYIKQDDMKLIRVVSDPDDVVPALQNWGNQ